MTEVAFEIDGVAYEMPLPSSFDIDEAEIYFKYTGVVLEEMWLEDLGWDKLKTRPGFIPALAHVAYRRAHPGQTDADIQVVIGKQNRAALVGAWIASLPDVKPSEDPKEPSDDPTNSSPTSSATDSKQNGTTSEPKTSGSDSTPSSARQDDDPESIGTSGSDGPATSVPLRRVV